MDLYKSKYWNVVFGSWCQDHPEYCIIRNDKESLMLFNKKYVDRHLGYNFGKWDLSKFKSQKIHLQKKKENKYLK